MALAAAEGAFEDDQVPLTKFGSGTGPTLKFYYWLIDIDYINCFFFF